MKIIHFDKKEGIAKIQVNTLDDLWHLSKIIDVNDFVFGQVERKIKLGSTEEKSRVVRKTYNVKIVVTKVTLEANSLRITGNIVEASDELPKGVSQTIDVSQKDIVKIEKNWKGYQIARMQEAEKSSKTPHALLLVLDDSEANFAILTPSGIKHLGGYELGLTKKRMRESGKTNKFEKLAIELLRLDNEIKPTYIIIGSPLFWKNEFVKYINGKDNKIAKKIKLEDASTGSTRGFIELMNRGAFDKIIKEGRLQKEFNLVEALFREITSGGLGIYGYDTIKNAAECNAIKTLLIVDSVIEEMRLKNTFDELEYLIDLVEKHQGEVHIISAQHEAGMRLRGLGGIAGMLRFKV